MSTFYLKYRPQIIKELDLTSVREQLTQILQSKSIPHAFLFSGPRGLGKTSAARILAKAVNCENKNRKSIEPCDKCSSCKNITKGIALDVIEIDGASNRGIDDIRALRDSVATSPVNLNKKIYIIDEVHMLTKEAFNALLKTLEEPPEHVIFIFATTAPERIPDTILSRVFNIKFSIPTKDEVARCLNRVAINEKINLQDSVIDLIYKQSEGGFRDSVKMLEQLSFIDKNITLEVFESLFSKLDLAKFFKFINDANIRDGIQYIKNQELEGIDWHNFYKTIMDQLQQQLENIYFKKDKKLHLSDILTKTMIEYLVKNEALFKNTSMPSLLWELMLVDLQEIKKTTIPNNKLTKNLVINSKKNDLKINPKVTKTVVNFSLDQLKQKWDQLLESIKPLNHSVSALLKSAQPDKLDQDTVVIKVYYQFHKERLEDRKSLSIVEMGFENIFACRVKLRYILGDPVEKKSFVKKQDDNLSAVAEKIFV